MVYSIEWSVSIYNDNNFRASVVPNLIFYFSMTEFQKWLNMSGKCKKQRCFIVSECVCFLFTSCEE